MLIYILLLLAIIILPKFKISKKTYCIIIGFLITLMVGFRDVSMGMNDTKLIYLPIFTKLSQLSVVESYNYIQRGGGELVFYMLTRFYIMLSTNYRIYLIILSLIVNIFVGRFIYKYSNNASLSFILFFSLNYFAMEFTLLRHCIAMAIVLFSYDFIVKKQKIKFVITVLIAALFHKTAILFLVAYPISYFKTGYKNFLAIGISLIASATIGKKLLLFAITILKHKKYLAYMDSESSSLTFFFMNLLIYLVIFFGFRKKPKNTNYNALMNIYTVGICVSTGTIFLGEAFRLCTYFMIFSIIIVPNMLSMIKDSNSRVFVIFIFDVLLIAYFFLFTMNNNCIYPYILGEFNLLV